MVVICTRCATQFQFDESRLPLEGAKMRCSRCKESFFLAHPQSTPEPEEEFFDRGLLEKSDSPTVSALEASGADLDSAEPPSGDDLDWDFDFNAQSEPHGSADGESGAVASEADDRSGSSSRSLSKRGEQAVFASVEDLADWLADRTDTLEPDSPPVRAEPTEGPSSSARAPGSALSLGRMTRKPENSEKTPDRRSEEGGIPVRDAGLSGASADAQPNAEELLADLLGMSQTEIPPWLRSGIRSAVQVLGWGVTLVLVTAGLVNGLRSAF